MLSYYTLRSRITAFGLWSLVGRAGSVRRMATTRKAVVKFGPYEVTDQVSIHALQYISRMRKCTFVLNYLCTSQDFTSLRMIETTLLPTVPFARRSLG